MHYRLQQILRQRVATPRRRRAGGSRAGSATATQGPPLPRPPASITAERPTARTHHAGFVSIAHPAVAPAGVANEAWYGLKRIEVRDRSERCALTGFAMTLMSPRTADSGVNKQWATSGGFDAYIVIGRNLTQMREGEWTRAAAPFVPLPTTSPVVPANNSLPKNIITAVCFPPGAFTDANPSQKALVREFGLETYPLNVGDTLDVALVILNSRLTTTPANLVSGFAQVELKTADLYPVGKLVT